MTKTFGLALSHFTLFELVLPRADDLHHVFICRLPSKEISAQKETTTKKATYRLRVQPLER